MKRMAAVIGTAFAIGLLSMPAAMDVLAADITEARAKEIAMEHAGVSEKKIPFIKAELDHEDGKQIYEVKFHTRDREEYEYEIDVSSGRIIKAEYDANDSSGSRDSRKDSYIKLERAQEIAAEHAGFPVSEVTFIKAGLNHEDGRQVYEIEFVTDDCREFDYEVDPVSGKILSYDYDAGHYDKDAGEGGNTKKITLGKAKEIALKQAGVKDSQAVYTKAGQDWDDGRLVYKVEFVSGGLEYECKIDAGTGEIVDWDVEHD